MLLTPHALVGAVIGAEVSNPFISIPLAFISYFLLDLISHWNPNSKQFKRLSFYPVYVTDLILSLTIGVFASYKFNNPVIIVTTLSAIIPDLLQISYYLVGPKSPLFLKMKQFYNKFNLYVKNVFIGSLSQILVILLSLYIITLRR